MGWIEARDRWRRNQEAAEERDRNWYSNSSHAELFRSLSGLAGRTGVAAPGWLDRVGQTYIDAGYSPAAAAQGTQRAQREGFLQQIGIGDAAWRRLQQYITSLEAREGSIDTRSNAGAFWRGFLGGGGAQASGDYAGSLAGSPGDSSTGDSSAGEPFYP